MARALKPRKTFGYKRVKKYPTKTFDYKKKKRKEVPSAVDSYKKYKNAKPIDTRQSKADPRDKYRSPYTNKLPYADAIKRRNNKAAEGRQSTRFGDDRTGPKHSGVNPSQTKQPKIIETAKEFIDRIKKGQK